MFIFIVIDVSIASEFCYAWRNVYHCLLKLVYYTKKTNLFYPNLVSRKGNYYPLAKYVLLRAETTEAIISWSQLLVIDILHTYEKQH